MSNSTPLLDVLGEMRGDLVVSRDVRVRRNDADWFIHFRANAPANYGLILSDDAFELLVSFAPGVVPRRPRDRQLAAVQQRIIRQFVETGFLINTVMKIDGRKCVLSMDEIMTLRKKIDINHLGLLELECVVLYLLARENSLRADICELGSMMGGSTIALALGARKSGVRNQVLAVDDHEWHKHLAINAFASDPLVAKEAVRVLPSSLPIFERNLRAAGVSSRVTPIVSDTRDAAKKTDKDISLLFIDATHSLEAIHDDFDSWFPKLLPGGVVVFHDYGNSNWPDVRTAVDELRGQFDNFVSYQTLALGRKSVDQ